MFQRLTISVVTKNKNKPQVKKLASPSSLFFFPFFSKSSLEKAADICGLYTPGRSPL